MSTHTKGQLILLSLGIECINFKQEQAIEDSKRKQPYRPAGTSENTPREPKRIVPPKPFKEMTGEEYNNWLNSHKLGI